MADTRADKFDRADFSARAATPAWQPSELRPDDQILAIVETGPPPPAPLTDDARTGILLRDGDSNRVILVDTGPMPAQPVTDASVVQLVQGGRVAPEKGAAVSTVAGRSIPLVGGSAVPASQGVEPVGGRQRGI